MEVIENNNPEKQHREWVIGDYERRIMEAKTDEEKKKVARELAEKFLKKEESSIRDPLTGAFNRRYLEETLEWEMKAAPFLGQHMGMVYLDIDNFKRVNDTDPRGHQAGDNALVVLVNKMREAVGVNGFVVRAHGEEFMLVVLNTDIDKLKTMAVELETSIKSNLVSEAHLLVPEMPVVSVSMGLAVTLEDERPEAFIRRTDKLMYDAKQGGKSRICYEGAGGQTETIQI
jgi:diguanylate cyclase